MNRLAIRAAVGLAADFNQPGKVRLANLRLRRLASAALGVCGAWLVVILRGCFSWV